MEELPDEHGGEGALGRGRYISYGLDMGKHGLLG